MLVLSRKKQESVVVASSDGHSCLVKVTIVEIRGERVRLGFEAHSDVPVHRWEVWQRMTEQNDFGDGESGGNNTSGRHGGKTDESASEFLGDLV